MKCENSKCGGCSMLDKEYEEQLKIKHNNIEKLLKNANFNICVRDVIGMENPYNYRNKGKYVFGNKSSKIVMGFFEEGSHKIVNTNNCTIQNEIINEVAQFIYELIQKYNINIYDEDNKKGFLRHVIVRHGVNTDELMIIFVTTNSKFNKRDLIIKELLEEYPNTKSIVQNINEKETSAILGSKNYNLYGNGYIVDKLENYKFKISPLSFYQVNSIQTEKLYNKAIEFASLKGNEIVFDLYSGIGTISIFASSKAKKVYGIEIVADAVKDAITNAKMNSINNVEFRSGKVEKLLVELVKKVHKADVVFVDPPRSGLDETTIKTLLEVKPSKIVYISCNPETLVENLKELKKEYDIKEVQPVDMFPQTHHVETICLLVKRNI